MAEQVPGGTRLVTKVRTVGILVEELADQEKQRQPGHGPEEDIDHQERRATAGQQLLGRGADRGRFRFCRLRFPMQLPSLSAEPGRVTEQPSVFLRVFSTPLLLRIT